MTCAKTVVICDIVTAMGRVFTGSNACEQPQQTCPRLPGEGYEKCVSICQQPGHAEIMALREAGIHAKGAKAYIYGIGHVCRECQEALYDAGVESISVKRNLADREMLEITIDNDPFVGHPDGSKG